MSSLAFIKDIIQLLWPDVGEVVQRILGMTGISKYIQVDLGQKLPEVTDIRFLEEISPLDEIMLDIDVKFSSDAKIKISIAGIDTAVENFDLEGNIQCSLKTKPTPPFVAGYKVYSSTFPIVIRHTLEPGQMTGGMTLLDVNIRQLQGLGNFEPGMIILQVGSQVLETPIESEMVTTKIVQTSPNENCLNFWVRKEVVKAGKRPMPVQNVIETPQPDKYANENQSSSSSSSSDLNILDLLDPFRLFHEESDDTSTATEVVAVRGSVDLSKIQEKPIDERINLIPSGSAWINVAVTGKVYKASIPGEPVEKNQNSKTK